MAATWSGRCRSPKPKRPRRRQKKRKKSSGAEEPRTLQGCEWVFDARFHSVPNSVEAGLTYIEVQCNVLPMIAKDLVAASSRPLILSILVEGESYGYAIIQRVRELSEGEMEWTDGMLYPVLHWLEENRYVKSRWGESDTGRKRKYYSLRPAGAAFLAGQKIQWTAVNRTLRRAWRIQ